MIVSQPVHCFVSGAQHSLNTTGLITLRNRAVLTPAQPHREGRTGSFTAGSEQVDWMQPCPG